MNVIFTVEKRGSDYVVVLDYPERKKGSGTVFYSSKVKANASEWARDNSTPQQEGEQQ